MTDWVKKIVLNVRIEVKRRKMFLAAKTFGYTDNRTVTCSQELDELLTKYQRDLISS
ncbi:aspartyl-phosphate phosphatase Spo0E family protein [Pseudalkalibacillus caeni]|uniref:Aspartyl-phosphate phosphatase Spo0E family protein n=1 Tax=Exobacillus caeni TaxID=2574798 RepID=A0A5R9F415_9BACL|nr:aspartyl-phosphate phosphatase Spo0E family protein [Pseudalkalibacillus caeni]TLS37130.1 aspartyl-phosphate phosphatase Spo0E family protein [Pseudalkalibacillus caeni]